MNIHSPSENLIAARFRWPWLQVSKKRNDEGNTEGLASAIIRRDITPPLSPPRQCLIVPYAYTYIYPRICPRSEHSPRPSIPP